MQFLQKYEQILQFIGVAVTTFTSVVVFSKAGRGWLGVFWKKFVAKRKLKKDLPTLILTISQEMGAIKEDIKNIKYEMQPNGGGNFRDSIKLIRAEIEAANWLSPRPSFRMTSSGLNVFVNEAYCQLCGVTSDELMRLGWMNFAVEADQMDQFFERMLATLKELSQYSHKLKIQTKDGEYRGEWMVRLRMLGPITNASVAEYLWHGGLYPVDDEARAYARQNNVPIS